MGGSAVLNVAAGAVGASVNLAIAALVGRHLGAEGTGTYFLVVAAFLIAANTAELGADTGLVRFVSAARAVGRPEEARVLLRSAVRPVLLVVGMLVVATAAIVLAVDPVRSVEPGVLVAASVAAGSLSMVAVLLGLTRGFDDVLTYPALQNVLLPLGRLGAVGLAVLAGWGVSGLLAAWLSPVPLVLALATVVAVRLVRRGSPRTPAVGPARRQEIGAAFWGFTAARGVTACVEILLEWIDVILVGALASPAEAGVYAVVTRCLRASEIVQQAARIVVGPQISAALARGDLAHARAIYEVVTATMIWVAWPFFILVAVFAEPVLRIFGPGFSSGATPMAVLAAAMALSVAAGTVQTILLMGGRSTWQLADKTGALLLNITLDLLLIPIWGITGAAIAWAVTIVADTLVVVWQVQGLMGIRPSGRHLKVAMVQPLAVIALPALAARTLFGTSGTTAAITTVVLGVGYVWLGWRTRHALGLVQMMTLRDRVPAPPAKTEVMECSRPDAVSDTVVYPPQAAISSRKTGPGS